MRIICLTSVLALAATTACVNNSADPRPSDVQEDWRSGGKGDGQTCDFGPMSAATYYAQFDYQEIASTTSTSKWYRAGFTMDVAAVLDNGDKAALTVYFLPSDRVIAEYSEEHRIDSSSSEVLNQTVFVTHRSLDPSTRTITLAGLGSGTPITVTNSSGHCLPGIAFTHSGDLRSPGLNSDHSVLDAGMTSAYVIDPDHLDQVPSAEARRYFEEDVASGKIKVVHL